MPVPGGRPAPGRPAPAEQRQTPAEQAEAFDVASVSSGLNPLVAAANRLLNVLPQLRSSVQHPNPTALRDSLAQGIRQFEAQARTAGVSTEKIVAARYALCTLIDETATSTPLRTSGRMGAPGSPGAVPRRDRRRREVLSAPGQTRREPSGQPGSPRAHVRLPRVRLRRAISDRRGRPASARGDPPAAPHDHPEATRGVRA